MKPKETLRQFILLFFFLGGGQSKQDTLKVLGVPSISSQSRDPSFQETSNNSGKQLVFENNDDRT